MKTGDTFVLRLPNKIPHLWIIISDHTPNNEVVIVNVTTADLSSDSSCVITLGEHPFIKHASVVAYYYARLIALEKITEWKNKHYYESWPPVKPPLLRKIQQGAIDSDFTPQKIQEIIRRQMEKYDK